MIGGGVLDEAGMIDGFRAPSLDAIIPGQVGRHLSGPRRIQLEGAPVESESPSVRGWDYRSRVLGLNRVRYALFHHRLARR